MLFNIIAGNSGTDTLLFLFPVEGAWTGWMGERYDLSISANNYGLLGLEGNGAIVASNRARLGILHGFQMGALSALEDAGDGMAAVGASAGLFFQTMGKPKSNFFTAARYAYNALIETGETEPESSYHQVVFSLGGSFNYGRLQVIPEIIVDAAFMEDRDIVNIMILPTLTASANY